MLAALGTLYLEAAPSGSEAEEWRQVLLWQGPGPKAPGAPVLSCLTPALPLLLFDVFPSASVAKVSAPAMDICFFQRNKFRFYFMLPAIPACFFAWAPQSPQGVAETKQVSMATYRQREELQPGRAYVPL